MEGTKEICSVTYKDLPQDVQPGGTIMLDDGLIMLHIEQVTDTDIILSLIHICRFYGSTKAPLPAHNVGVGRHSAETLEKQVKRCQQILEHLRRTGKGCCSDGMQGRCV